MAKVFNIQRYSIHDGPGIRTTVFFKGCPLKCQWCHNPEGISFDKELMIYKDRCISCGYCIEACKFDAINNKENCTLCEKCCTECPTNSRVMVGKDMTIDKILEEVEKDRIFYDISKGGVTLSGGEPLAQGDFLMDLVKELKKRSLHIAIDTSGYASWETIERLFPNVDLFLYDLKVINELKHIEYTGVSNKLIIENLGKLAKAGKATYVRIPIIPGVNTEASDIKEFIGVLKSSGIYNNINLLPYHNISMEKYNRLNIDYRASELKEPSDEDMEVLKEVFEKEGLNVKIGG